MNAAMVISEWIVMNNLVERGSKVKEHIPETPSADATYRSLRCDYAKFFKMDLLCKWAWLGAECLLGGKADLHTPHNAAVCLTTGHGCIDVDKRYLDGIEMASPALFVYTLPNIMLGELCIRHGFKGEQQCMVSEKPDWEELYFSANGMLERGMDSCLCGWVDVDANTHDVCLFWVTKGGSGYGFTPSNMQRLYTSGVNEKQ